MIDGYYMSRVTLTIEVIVVRPLDRCPHIVLLQCFVKSTPLLDDMTVKKHIFDMKEI